ncbi:hypothetical protein ACFPYM_04910 [Methylobacterium hispanicum]|uniref:hypothetical protein n=1 Tax=Methylobacterium hispanicum TaxID=270350 RepID=UPI001EDF9661|nr:hypothetical protein [Methylobacterium hispanicum]
MKAVIQKRAPQLAALKPEQILEVREFTGSYRDGFRAYLAELADDVEAKTKDGYSLDQSGKIVFERKVEPKLLEEIRQSIPCKIAWWADLLKKSFAIGGNAVTICAAPWSAGNYTKLSENMGDFVKAIAVPLKEKRSNKGQAFQFIGNLPKPRRPMQLP